MAEIIDFTEHYMHMLIDRFAKANDEPMAHALSETLDRYIMGEIGLLLIEGVPVPYTPVYALDDDTEHDV